MAVSAAAGAGIPTATKRVLDHHAGLGIGTETVGSCSSPPLMTKSNHSNFYDLPEPVANRLSYDEIETSRARELNKMDNSEDDPGPIKKKFMPFFRKFWPHLDPEAHTDLSQKRRLFSPRLYGKAVEEVDPFVFEDTFCVLSKKFNKNYVFRFSSTRSLFIFGPMNAFRRLCIYIVTHQVFDLLIIVAILCNCVALSFDSNKVVLDEEKGLWYTAEYKLHPGVEWGFLIIYTVELILKVVSKGFVLNKFSYLRNPWNCLDFIVVVFGYVTEILQAMEPAKTLNPSETKQSSNLDFLRTFRVLRAVKTISILPGLRMIINALLNAMVQLLEVMLLTVFCLCIFALFALEVYMGKLHQVCVLIKGSETSLRENRRPNVEPISETDPNRHYLYSTWVNNRQNWYQRDFPKQEYQPCGNDTGSRACPRDYVCLPNLNDNPDDGWTSFDNIFASMLSTFQLITLDYWERLYELVMSTVGPWSLAFFIMVVFLGSFYLLNLMLAVVAMSYEAEAHSWEQKPLTKHQKLTLHRSDSTFSFDDPLKLNVTVLTTYRRRTPAEREMLARTLRNASIGKRKQRRAIKRKLLGKPGCGGARNTSGGGLGVSSASGTGACTPDVRSATGSICGSLYSGGGGGEGTSPTPLPRPRTGKGGNKTLMSGVLGERSIPPPQPRSAPPALASIVKSTMNRKKKFGGVEEGEYKVVSFVSPRKGDETIEPVLGVNCVSECGEGSGVLVKKPTGGIRVSARVTTCDDENEPARFYLETAAEKDEMDRTGGAGSLTDAIMNLLGRRLSDGHGTGVIDKSGSSGHVQEVAVPAGSVVKDSEDAAKAENEEDAHATSPTPSVQIVPSQGSVSIMDEAIAYRTKQPDPSAQHRIRIHKESRPSITSVNSQEIESRTYFELHRRHRSPIRAMDKEAKESRNVFERVRRRLIPIVTHYLFEGFITACIVINTILLASEHHDMPQWLENTIMYGSHCFTAVFTLECIIKLIALQKDYFSQYWNLFDLFVVLVSFVDLVIELLGSNFAFRVVRLLRIFKLAQSWLTMKVLLNIIFSTFGALGNLTLVLAIFIYIFAVLGMQIIGGQYTPQNFDATSPEEENFPRWNFSDFWHAFMMVFRVLCGEWIEPLWDCLTCHREAGVWKCFVIFLPILVFGNFIVLNLFLALLLNSFNTEELKAQRDKEKELSGKVDNLKKVVGMLMMKSDRNEEGRNDLEEEIRKRRMSTGASRARRESRLKVKFKAASHKVVMANRKFAAERAIKRTTEMREKKPAGVKRTDDEDNDKFLSNPLASGIGDSPSKTSQPDPDDDDEDNAHLRDCCAPSVMSYNLLCLKYIRNYQSERWHNARAFCLKIVIHPSFEWIVLVMILGSSITLCFEDVHLEESSNLKLTLFILNNTFTGLFVIEMLLKWMALGLHKYFTNFWTILDVFIVTVSLVTLGYDISCENWKTQNTNVKTPIQSLKALRTLRALRPLRAISRWQGMKVVVNALLYAIPSIVNVLLVCLLFWLVFAIMGVQFFKGKFFKCIYSESGDLVSYNIVQDMVSCCSNPDMSWINTTPNFDNVLQGYLSLFQVATFEGWMELMRAASDVPDAPDQNANRAQSYVSNAFFVIFIIFGSFFTLNLFIGVIIDNFNMLKKKYEGNLLEILLTPSQRRYYTAMKKLGRKKPRRVIKRPQNKCLALFYDISMSRRFEISIFVMIFLNMLVMSFEHHGQRQIYAHILTGCNSFFSTIYALEAMVKIIGMRHYYFTFPWNVFDFCLVVFSIIDLLLVDSEFLPFPPTLLRVVRVFRIGRVLRLIKAAKGIRKLLFALIVSLPALFNIGALLALLTFIYAIIGMAIFKDAALYKPLDTVFSFKTFPKATLMLFRLMTAAGWNDVLDALTVEDVRCGTYRKILCGREGEPDCVMKAAAVLYMVSYIILSYLIVINMYIAIILENFVEANRDEEIGIVEDDLEMFYVRWSRYDPSATQFISFDQLSEFLACLDPPLDVPRPNIVAIVSFNLPIARGNKIHCLDILHALVKHALGHVDDSDEFRKIQEQMEVKFRKQFPGRKLLDIISSTRIWKIQHNAAVIIQRAWRDYQARKNAPPDIAKSTQTMRSNETAGHGLGHAFNKIGQFFHVGGDHGKRRKSSVRDPALLFSRRRTSDKKDSSSSPGSSHHQLPAAGVRDANPLLKKLRNSIVRHGTATSTSGTEEALHQPPRSSLSSQSSSSASPLARVESGATGSHIRGRRLSPSRLSGGSFDVAVNYGMAMTMTPPINNQLLSIYLPTSQIKNMISPTLSQSGNSNNYDPSINISSPLTSSPTTPSSPPDESNIMETSIVVQVHDTS